MISNMHPEAITSEAKKLVKPLSQFDKYYLAGGTSLALQIGHRISIDYDFFTPKSIQGTMVKLESLFGEQSLRIIVNQDDQLTVSIKNVQVSFIHYPFSIFVDYINWNGINLLTPEIISAMKAYTLGRRATFKDYVDLYYVIKLKIAKLSEIIELANNFYGTNFNDRLFLEQLIFLEDISDDNIEFLKNPVSKDEIENFFENQVEKYELH